MSDATLFFVRLLAAAAGGLFFMRSLHHASKIGRYYERAVYIIMLLQDLFGTTQLSFNQSKGLHVILYTAVLPLN